MDKCDLRDILLDYHSQYNEEILYKRRMLHLLDHYSDCFERSCLSGHFTGSAWILNHDHSKALLVHHKKLNRWLQPGGHADGEVNLFNVAYREAREETGISGFQMHGSIFDLDIHLIPKRKDVPAHYHFDLRAMLTADEQENIVINEESNDVKWISINKISSLLSDNSSITRMVNKTRMMIE